MEVGAKDYAKLAGVYGDDYGPENVLAAHCRRRGMSIKAVAREWGLTDAEARGVLAARAGKATVRKILKHKNGGWPIGLLLLTGVIGHDLQTHIARERERERKSWEQIDAGYRSLGRGVRALHPLDIDRRA